MTNKESNLRTLDMKPGMGVEACESSQLEGEAKITKAFTATNSTEQYKTGKDAAPGPHGGKPNYGK